MATVTETAAVAGVTARSELGYDLKIDYLEMQEAWLHSPEQTIPNRVAQKRGKLAGLKSQFMVPTSAPTGVGSRLEKWKLPTHRSAGGANPEILARAFKLRTRITTEADLATKAKGTQGAFAAAKSLEQQMIRDQLARQWIGNLVRGNFDVLGVSQSTLTGTSISPVLYGRNARRSTSPLTFIAGTNESAPLHQNMPVTIVRAANVAGNPAYSQSSGSGFTGLGDQNEIVVGTIDISDMDNPIVPLTSGSSITINAGDYLVPYGSRSDVAMSGVAADDISKFAGMNGLMQSRTGTTPYAAYLGLAKASYSGLRGNHIQGSPIGTQRDWSTILCGQVIRNAQARSGKAPSVAICAPEMFDEIFKESLGQMRFGEVVGNKGGADLGITMHGVRIGFEFDYLQLPGLVDLFNDQFEGYFETCPLMSPDPISERYVPDYDQLETVLVKIGNTACSRPFAGGRLDDLNYTY